MRCKVSKEQQFIIFGIPNVELADSCNIINFAGKLLGDSGFKKICGITEMDTFSTCLTKLYIAPCYQ